MVVGQESYISTSHNPANEIGGEYLARDELNKLGINSVTALLHDHPYQMRYNGLNSPSGFYLHDLNSGKLMESDRSAAIWFDEKFPRNVIDFEVYDVATSQWFDYTRGRSPGVSFYNFFYTPQPLNPQTQVPYALPKY